eukprot:8080936-Ditylum_brightwellii.AAC.1
MGCSNSKAIPEASVATSSSAASAKQLEHESSPRPAPPTPVTTHSTDGGADSTHDIASDKE